MKRAKRISIYTILVLTFSLLQPIYLSSQPLDFSIDIKNFSKDDYKAEYQNWAVDIGPDNYIYTANNAGLLVYDGVNWEFHKSQEINNIRSVKVDKNTGRIFTSGYREIGYWEWDSLGSLKYHSFNETLKYDFTDNEEFWKILSVDKRLIFQSFQGLFILEDDEFTIMRPGGFLNTISILDDKLLLHILNRGIFQLEGDSIRPFLTDPFFNQKLIRFIIPWDSNKLLLGTASNGVYFYDGENFSEAFGELGSLFREANINRANFLNDSVLIIGTILDGVIGLDKQGKVLFRINEDNGLQNNTILAIESKDNVLWLALDRGLSFINLKANPSYTIHTTNNIGATYTAALFNGFLYLGTNQGLYSKPVNEVDQEFTLVPNTQGQVWDCKVFDNKLFVSHNSGTFVLSENEAEQISTIGGGFSLIKNSYQLNSLLQCTYTSILLFEKNANGWGVKHQVGGFSDLIRYIELDHLNNLWAGHMRRSIYKLKLNDSQDSIIERQYYGEFSIFNKEYGINVFKVENRIVFTSGEQLYTYDDMMDSIISFDQLNDQIGNYKQAHRIVKAPDHHYWFITNSGIALFQFQNRGVRMIAEYPSEVFDNHIIDGYENIIPTASTTAIYCLENGYALLDASTGGKNDMKQRKEVIQRGIVAIDRSGNEFNLELGKSRYVLSYSKNSLNLQYALPDYQAKNLDFKIYIDGLHSQWMSSGNTGNFEISRIPSGEYVVNVIAENEWHQESIAHQFRLKIFSPWYRSILAWILYSWVLLLLVLWVRNVSVKRIKAREKKKLDINEQELIRLRNQNLRSDLRFKSRELANSTMSIIKKNEFLLELKNILKEQKYQLGTRYPDKFYLHILKKIDKNISASDDWKIFETNVDKAHEFFLQKLINEYPQLTHSDLRLCTYLRMNLSSKEIAPLMKISVRGVENHRYRLRKKFELDASVNLTDFILAYKV